MAILNYTTTIAAEKTGSEIQAKLAKAGAGAVMSEFDDDGVMSAMAFRLMTPHGLVYFRLPANIDGVYKALLRNPKVPKKLQTNEQAARVAWRIVKDWVEAQIAIVEADMAEMTEVFLPYAQGRDGKTMYEALKSGGFEALTHDA